MITHIVLLSWKEGVSQNQIDKVAASFQELKEEIPEIVSYRFGEDAGIFKGNADYVLIAEFENEEDLKAYVKHPRHQDLLANITGPILESFQSIQLKD